MADDTDYGQYGNTDINSHFNATRFVVKQMLAELRTHVPVQIVAVHGGGVGSPPTVDVTPVITQIDSGGKATPHGIIYGVQTQRNQGGNSAIINDPVVGDVMLMAVADRDISSLKANGGAQSNPGSFRRHDLADGVIVGKLFNNNKNQTAPTNYIQALPNGGWKLADQFGNSITTGAHGITLTDCNGNIFDMKSGSIAATSANLTNTGGIQAGVGGADSVTLQGHKHAGGPPPDPGT